jgi:hypothetical protein
MVDQISLDFLSWVILVLLKHQYDNHMVILTNQNFPFDPLKKLDKKVHVPL